MHLLTMQNFSDTEICKLNFSQRGTFRLLARRAWPSPSLGEITNGDQEATAALDLTCLSFLTPSLQSLFMWPGGHLYQSLIHTFVVPHLEKKKWLLNYHKHACGSLLASKDADADVCETYCEGSEAGCRESYGASGVLLVMYLITPRVYWHPRQDTQRLHSLRVPSTHGGHKFGSIISRLAKQATPEWAKGH